MEKKYGASETWDNNKSIICAINIPEKEDKEHSTKNKQKIEKK